MRAVTPPRLVVFLDYQNVYKGARECFHDRSAPHFNGQVDPIKLGEYLAADSNPARNLIQVRIYRGLPDAALDPKGYSASSRQNDIWRQDKRVVVKPRPLSYPRGWPKAHKPGEKPREKGIDVQLALDFVMIAVRGEYDVGILMSTDTDLKPALEEVTRLGIATTYPRAELAAWSAPDMHSRRLSIATAKLWCHWLDKRVYDLVRDDTDYSDSAQRQA